MILSNVAPVEEMVPWVAPELLPDKKNLEISSEKNSELSSESELVDSVETRIEEARLAGFHNGYREGQAESIKQAENESEQLSQVLNSLSHPLAKVNDEVMQELLDFGFTLAKIIVKRELESDSGYYLKLVQKICTEYARDVPSVSILLNPQDVTLLQSYPKTEETLSILDTDVRLVADSDLSRGSCLMDTGDFFVDVGVTSIIERVAMNLAEEKSTVSTDN